MRWLLLGILVAPGLRARRAEAQQDSAGRDSLTLEGRLNQLDQEVRVLDYEHTTFVGGAAVGDRRPENFMASRVQYAF